MTTDSDSALIHPEPLVWYTRDVRDVSRGFSVEPFEFYQMGQHWLKLVYFFDQSSSSERWTRHVRELGKPNEGRTLLQNTGEWWWRLDGVDKYLVIGLYEHTFNEVCWFAAHSLSTGWETIQQDGSIEALKSGSKQTETFQIAGKSLELSFCNPFYNPFQSGGWTSDDIIYQVEG